jgi:hypothetical protein
VHAGVKRDRVDLGEPIDLRVLRNERVDVGDPDEDPDRAAG